MSASRDGRPNSSLATSAPRIERIPRSPSILHSPVSNGTRTPRSLATPLMADDGASPGDADMEAKDPIGEDLEGLRGFEEGNQDIVGGMVRMKSCEIENGSHRDRSRSMSDSKINVGLKKTFSKELLVAEETGAPLLLERLEEDLKSVLAPFNAKLGTDVTGMYRKHLRQFRFMMRARTETDIKKSVENYNLSISLRKKHNCDSIWNSFVDGKLCVDKGMLNLPQARRVRSLFPVMSQYCLDKFGRPVAFLAVKHIKIHRLMKEIPPEDYFDYELYRWEYMSWILNSVSEKTGRLAQWVVIVDMAGYSSDVFSRKGMGFLRQPHQVLNKIHKELLGPIYVINAPTIFQAIWSVAKYFVTKRTRQKIWSD
ncbi:hypothetical protein AAMO2058_000551600 [Amorphochlora amoebiformis]